MSSGCRDKTFLRILQRLVGMKFSCASFPGHRWYTVRVSALNLNLTLFSDIFIVFSVIIKKVGNYCKKYSKYLEVWFFIVLWVLIEKLCVGRGNIVSSEHLRFFHNSLKIGTLEKTDFGNFHSVSRQRLSTNKINKIESFLKWWQFSLLPVH